METMFDNILQEFNYKDYMREVGYKEEDIPSIMDECFLSESGPLYLMALAKFNSNTYKVFTLLTLVMKEKNKVIVKQDILSNFLKMNRKTVSKAINFLLNNKFIKKGNEPFVYYLNSFIINYEPEDDSPTYWESIGRELKDHHYYLDIFDIFGKKKLIKR